MLIHTNFLTMISLSLFCCCGKVFSHGWLGKIRWNIITTEKNSKSIKHERYYWFRLYQCKKSLHRFGNKNSRQIYHDLHVQNDALLLADIFNNFGNICLKIYEFDRAHFFRTRINMAKSFKKTKVKLYLSTDLLTNNKYMNDYHKNKELLYLSIGI